MSDADNVHQFPKPKTLRKTYKRHNYVLTYIPATKRWKWEVTYVSTSVFGEEAATMSLAQRAAEKHIDQTLGVGNR